MRRHKPWLLLLGLVLVATGCSRLTFIKPKMERKDGEQIAPTYQVSDSPETRRRMEAERALALATNACSRAISKPPNAMYGWRRRPCRSPPTSRPCWPW